MDNDQKQKQPMSFPWGKETKKSSDQSPDPNPIEHLHIYSRQKRRRLQIINNWKWLH